MHYFYAHSIHKTVEIKFKTFSFRRIIIIIKKKLLSTNISLKQLTIPAKQLYGALCKLISSCNLVDNYSPHFC